MDLTNILKPELPDQITDTQRDMLKARLAKLSGGKSNGPAVDLANLLAILEEMEKREDTSGIKKWFMDDGPYSIHNLPKHKAFFAATKDHRENLLLGGNRSGKTTAGAYICAVVATGMYPDWWEGFVVDGPASIWAVGQTSQTTRDTVQEALMGPIGAWGTGMLPKDSIVKITASKGIAGAIDTVQVRHVSGAISTIGFKSYDQRAASFFGTAKHITWLDEPADDDIYNESLVRLMRVPDTEDGTGRMIHTITPKKGLTRLLADYLSDCDLLAGTEKFEGLTTAKALMDYENRRDDNEFGTTETKKSGKHHRAAITIAWDDIPWLGESVKNEILASTPPHLRATISKGIPSIGSGSVYPIPLEDVLLKPEDVKPIPAFWPRIYGMDVGFRCTAAVFLAYDPDNDIVYVTGEHYMKEQPPEMHAAGINRVAKDWMPGVIDPASKQRDKNGDQLIRTYRSLGLRISEADNSVMDGIQKIWSRLATGKLKFFPNTPNLQNEYILYRYDDHNKPIKENDHALDALRYAINMLHMARPTPGPMAGAPPMIQVRRDYFRR